MSIKIITAFIFKISKHLLIILIISQELKNRRTNNKLLSKNIHSAYLKKKLKKKIKNLQITKNVKNKKSKENKKIKNISP